MNNSDTDGLEGVCNDCGGTFPFLPYWESTPVCYACYFLRVGDYKVAMNVEIERLKTEVDDQVEVNNRLGGQLEEAMARISRFQDIIAAYEELMTKDNV